MEGIERENLKSNGPPYTPIHYNTVSSRGRPRNSRGTNALPADSSLHPIIRFGWKPICNVVCNGLYGEFLGGHDRDMFIQVTSGSYAGLPLIDASMGGCIMTCSQFERAAGRELSKKWKESIHVVGEGEGSRATLLSWLKRAAEHDYGTAVVGRNVWICWCADAEYYKGTIIAFNRDSGKHTVQYDSHLVEDLHLCAELTSFQQDRPHVPMNTGSYGINITAAAITAPVGAVSMDTVVAVDTPAATATPTNDATTDGIAAVTPSSIKTAIHRGNAAQPAPLSSPKDVLPSAVMTSTLWHQGSGVSVSSSDELKAAATGFSSGHVSGRGTRSTRSNRRARAASTAKNTSAMVLTQGSGRFAPGSESLPPPPKRAISAPAAVILAEAAAAAAALLSAHPTTELDCAEGHQTSNHKVVPSNHPLVAGPLTPGTTLPSHQHRGRWEPSPPHSAVGDGLSDIPAPPAHLMDWWKVATTTVSPSPSSFFSVDDDENEDERDDNNNNNNDNGIPSPLPTSPPPPTTATRGKKHGRSQHTLNKASSLVSGSSAIVPSMVKWMHDVALSLDWDLEDFCADKPSSLMEAAIRAGIVKNYDVTRLGHMDIDATMSDDGAHPEQQQQQQRPWLPPVSPSARFQSLVARMRGRSPGAVEGLFEAMMARYSYFASNPSALKRKLCEFIVATLHDAPLFVDMADGGVGDAGGGENNNKGGRESE